MIFLKIAEHMHESFIGYYLILYHTFALKLENVGYSWNDYVDKNYVLVHWADVVCWNSFYLISYILLI